MKTSYRKNNSLGLGWDKRITILSTGVLIVALFLIWKLFSVSVLEHETYKALADSQHMVKKDLSSRRGRIFLKDYISGEDSQIVVNDEKYDVNVVPKNVKNPSEVAEKLAPLIEIDKNELEEDISGDELYLPPVKKRIDYDLAQEIADMKLSGVLITSVDSRYYPENELASQIIGFVNFDGDGKYGVEGYYDEQLKGEVGAVEGIKDTHGKMVTAEISEQVKNGADLYLTIDSNVQYVAEQKAKQAVEDYEAESASIIIANPNTGAILAMANNNTYDPNAFNEVAKEHGQSLFNNPLISTTWEPGSIFKPLVMAMAIDKGHVEPDTEEVFGKMVKVQNYEIHTAEDEAFGRETMTEVLENSDNVAMVWLGDKIGNDDMYSYIDKFGFGRIAGIDLEGEASGSLLELKKWRDIHRATMSFGQGIAVTPLQIVMSYSALANGGQLLKPYVLDKMVTADDKDINTETTVVNDQVISSETADKITDMMVSVVDNGHGHNAAVEGYSIAGKTGTAQIADSAGGYKEDEFIHSFSGFFPTENPEFVMLVRVVKPKKAEFAAGSAAPVFGDMAKWLLQYYEIQPTR